MRVISSSVTPSGGRTTSLTPCTRTMPSERTSEPARNVHGSTFRIRVSASTRASSLDVLGSLHWIWATLAARASAVCSTSHPAHAIARAAETPTPPRRPRESWKSVLRSMTVEASYGIPRPDARAQRARVRGMRFRLAWAIGAAIALSASTATANGRFPASNQFLFSPSNPNLIWLRTTYGILPSTDDGSSWAYLCEDVFGLQSAGGSGYEDPGVALMSNGNVIVSDSRGVSVSTDQGCTWSCQGGMLAKQAFIDLAVSPSDVTTAVVLTATYVASDSGTTNTYSQVFRTTDYGMTWNPVGPPLDPTVLVQTVDLAKSDPTRIYVSGTRNFGIAKTASLFMYTMYTTAGDAGADDASADGGFAEGSADGGSANAGGQWLEQPITEFDNAQEESIYI